jgi:hypothetical protein
MPVDVTPCHWYEVVRTSFDTCRNGLIAPVEVRRTVGSIWTGTVTPPSPAAVSAQLDLLALLHLPLLLGVQRLLRERLPERRPVDRGAVDEEPLRDLLVGAVLRRGSAVPPPAPCPGRRSRSGTGTPRRHASRPPRAAGHVLLRGRPGVVLGHVEHVLRRLVPVRGDAAWPAPRSTCLRLRVGDRLEVRLPLLGSRRIVGVELVAFSSISSSQRPFVSTSRAGRRSPRDLLERRTISASRASISSTLRYSSLRLLVL